MISRTGVVVVMEKTLELRGTMWRGGLQSRVFSGLRLTPYETRSRSPDSCKRPPGLKLHIRHLPITLYLERGDLRHQRHVKGKFENAALTGNGIQAASSISLQPSALRHSRSKRPRSTTIVPTSSVILTCAIARSDEH